MAGGNKKGLKNGVADGKGAMIRPIEEMEYESLTQPQSTICDNSAEGPDKSEQQRAELQQGEMSLEKVE